MRRRHFLQTAAASAPFLMLPRKSFAQEAKRPDLVAVRNGEPDEMLDRAIKELGGMSRFVPKGSTVVVKPNIGWPRPVESGANTNPLLVKRVVQACLQAGAKKVYVFDHTVGEKMKQCYDLSGIGAAAKEAGAVVAAGSDRRHYQKQDIQDATRLKEVEVHELLLESDVLINIPVLKHHGGAKATIAMKNLMGCIWDRGAYHRQGLQECIADFCLLHKPQLNIVDAYRVTMNNGPQRARPEDVELKRMLIASPDIVAADAAAVRLLRPQSHGARHISLAAEKKIGTMDLDSLNIRKIAL
jgi:uncharacterized protein (DUF362 family)